MTQNYDRFDKVETLILYCNQNWKFTFAPDFLHISTKLFKFSAEQSYNLSQLSWLSFINEPNSAINEEDDWNDDVWLDDDDWLDNDDWLWFSFDIEHNRANSSTRKLSL